MQIETSSNNGNYSKYLIHYTGSESMSEDSDSVSHGSKVRVVVSTALHSHCQLSPMQVHSQPPEGWPATAKQPEPAKMKGECKVNTEAKESGWSPLFTILTLSFPAIETALDNLCWIPFGVQSQSAGPETGELCLQQSASTMGGEEEETILLEVPPGAICPS